MLADYGWQMKTWKLNEKEKMKTWIEKHKTKFNIREVFVNNRLAIEYKRLICL